MTLKQQMQYIKKYLLNYKFTHKINYELKQDTDEYIKLAKLDKRQNCTTTQI